MKKVILLIIFLVGVVIFLSFFFITNPTTSTSTILAQIKSENQNINWEVPKNVTEQTPLGNLSGIKMFGTLISQQATFPHFENAKLLSSYGYMPDMSFSADGPGSSIWGYRQNINGEESVILFSYNTKPTSTNPNAPLQFNCPCQMDISMFISNPFQSKDKSVNKR